MQASKGQIRFSKALKDARLAKGLTQHEAAEQLGVTREEWSKWETCKNKPQAQRYPALAAFIGCDARELAGWLSESKARDLRWVWRAAPLALLIGGILAVAFITAEWGSDGEPSREARLTSVFPQLVQGEFEVDLFGGLQGITNWDVDEIGLRLTFTAPPFDPANSVRPYAGWALVFDESDRHGNEFVRSRQLLFQVRGDNAGDVQFGLKDKLGNEVKRPLATMFPASEDLDFGDWRTVTISLSGGPFSNVQVGQIENLSFSVGDPSIRSREQYDVDVKEMRFAD